MCVGSSASSSCRSRSTPSFSSPAASPMSCVTSESTSTSLISSRSSVRPARLRTTSDVAVVLDHGRRRHPVQRLVPAGVGVDEHRAVVLQHQEPCRLRQERVQPAGVGDFAAGDDQAHARATYCPFRTCPGAVPGRCRSDHRSRRVAVRRSRGSVFSQRRRVPARCTLDVGQREAVADVRPRSGPCYTPPAGCDEPTCCLGGVMKSRSRRQGAAISSVPRVADSSTARVRCPTSRRRRKPDSLRRRFWSTFRLADEPGPRLTNHPPSRQSNQTAAGRGAVPAVPDRGTLPRASAISAPRATTDSDRFACVCTVPVRRCRDRRRLAGPPPALRPADQRHPVADGQQHLHRARVRGDVLVEARRSAARRRDAAARRACCRRRSARARESRGSTAS